jgi:hypothetical protein
MTTASPSPRRRANVSRADVMPPLAAAATEPEQLPSPVARVANRTWRHGIDTPQSSGPKVPTRADPRLPTSGN